MFSGTVPAELGKLENLETLYTFFLMHIILLRPFLIISSMVIDIIFIYNGLFSNHRILRANNLYGELPMELNSLTNLTELYAHSTFQNNMLQSSYFFYYLAYIVLFSWITF